MNKKERMYKQIEEHGKRLQAIFGLEGDPVALCKKLFRLENKAHMVTTAYCNGDINVEEYFKAEAHIIMALGKIVFPDGTIPAVPVFVNADCRGYALKIDDGYMREHNIDLYRDMGGYGILAPDFRENA